MAGSTDGAGTADVSLGDVMGRAIGTIRTNPVATLGICLLLGGVPTVAYPLLLRSLVAGGVAISGVALALTYVFGGLLVLLISALTAQGALVRAVTVHALGEKAGIGECMMTGLRKFLPLLGLSIIFGLVVGFATLLLIVPGIMLYVRYAICVPALVSEDVGIIESLERSAELTKGYRWQIFGIEILLIILGYMLSGAAAGIEYATGGLSAAGFAPLTVWGLANSTPSLIASTLNTALFSTVHTSLYISLRNAKEGVQVDQLAEIFA